MISLGSARKLLGSVFLSLCCAMHVAYPLSAADLSSNANPGSKANHVELGNKLLEKNDYKAALAEFNLALAENPDSAYAHFGRGLALASSGDYKQALPDYDEAIRLDKSNANFHYGRGAVLVRMNEHQRAIRDFDEVLRLNPSITDAWYSRAGEYYSLEEYQKAISDYDSTIKSDPAYADAYKDRGLTFFQIGDYAKARADFDKYYSSTKVPPGSQLLFYLGFSNLLDGRALESAHNFEDFFIESKEPGKDALLAAGCAAIARRIDESEPSAMHLLGKAASKVKDKDWPYPLLQYLQRLATIEDVLNSIAGDNGKLTEAHFYIGLSLSCWGSKEALSHFRWVVEKGNKGSLEYGLARAEVDKEHQRMIDRAMYRAIYECNLARVSRLFENGADMNSRGQYGDDTTLIAATIHGCPEIVKLLLARGIQPDNKLDDGRTALYFAAGDDADRASSRVAEDVRSLLSAGADANAADVHGVTPLMNAAMAGNVSAVKLLLEKKADVNRKTASDRVDAASGRILVEKGETALSLARKKLKFAAPERKEGCEETIRLLVKARAR